MYKMDAVWAVSKALFLLCLAIGMPDSTMLFVAVS